MDRLSGFAPLGVSGPAWLIRRVIQGVVALDGACDSTELTTVDSPLDDLFTNFRLDADRFTHDLAGTRSTLVMSSLFSGPTSYQAFSPRW